MPNKTFPIKIQTPKPNYKGIITQKKKKQNKQTKPNNKLRRRIKYKILVYLLILANISLELRQILPKLSLIT